MGGVSAELLRGSELLELLAARSLAEIDGECRREPKIPRELDPPGVTGEAAGESVVFGGIGILRERDGWELGMGCGGWRLNGVVNVGGDGDGDEVFSSVYGSGNPGGTRGDATSGSTCSVEDGSGVRCEITGDSAAWLVDDATIGGLRPRADTSRSAA